MGPWPVHCAQTGAGCPGWGPDVRGFARRRMSGLKWPNFWCVLSSMLDFRGGAGCPGFGEAPDVRPLMLLAVCWCSSLAAAQAPDVRPLARMSGRCSFSSSVFFCRRF